MKQKIVYSILSLIFFILNANIVSAAGMDYGYRSPITPTSLTAWLTNILSGLQGIVGILAIIMLIVAGILYIFSGVNSNTMTTAKNMATWALIGFTIAVAIPSLLKEIMSIMKDNPATSPDIITKAKDIKTILTGVLSFFLTIIGVLALISFVVGGFKYLFSAGDKGKTEDAKKIVFYSIIAVLVSGSGVIIIRQIFKLLER